MKPRTGEPAPAIPEAILEMAQRIVGRCHPLQVILFGSHARGDTNRRSDVDLLVLIPEGRDEGQAWDAAREALRGSSLPWDVIVVTADRARRLGGLVGTVFRPALREGKLLYDASARPKWDRTGRPVRLEVGPVSEDDRLAQTRLWLRQALTDLRTADLTLASLELEAEPPCYHAQQAAGKALKAVLVFLQVQYPFTHDLDASREEIPPDWDVQGEFRNLTKLSEWSFKARYPGPWAPPTKADAREATRLARAIYESVLRDLRSHGFPSEKDGPSAPARQG